VSARERLRGILLDMDGVLYSADNIIDGAGETAAWVRAQGIPHLFVTKTTSKSRVALADKLRSFGVPAQEEKNPYSRCRRCRMVACPGRKRHCSLCPAIGTPRVCRFAVPSRRCRKWCLVRGGGG